MSSFVFKIDCVYFSHNVFGREDRKEREFGLTKEVNLLKFPPLSLRRRVGSKFVSPYKVIQDYNVRLEKN